MEDLTVDLIRLPAGSMVIAAAGFPLGGWVRFRKPRASERISEVYLGAAILMVSSSSGSPAMVKLILYYRPATSRRNPEGSDRTRSSSIIVITGFVHTVYQPPIAFYWIMGMGTISSTRSMHRVRRKFSLMTEPWRRRSGRNRKR